MDTLNTAPPSSAWEPPMTGTGPQKMEVTCRAEIGTASVWMDKTPDEPGWLEQWIEIGKGARDAWVRYQKRSGEGSSNSAGPSAGNLPDVSSAMVE